MSCHYLTTVVLSQRRHDERHIEGILLRHCLASGLHIVCSLGRAMVGLVFGGVSGNGSGNLQCDATLPDNLLHH